MIRRGRERRWWRACLRTRAGNPHPFFFIRSTFAAYRRWYAHAHNGTCYGFSRFRERLLAAIRPSLRARIVGETDSEVLFYLILSRLDAAAVDADAPLPLHLLAAAGREATDLIWSQVPDRHPATCHAEDPTCLSFLLTDGVVLLAHQGGRPLHVALEHPSERSALLQCGAPLRRLRVASEPLSCSGDWTELATFEMVGAEPGPGDGTLRLRRFAPGLPAVAF